MPTDRFLRDKAVLRAELERQARVSQTMIYGEAAHLVVRAAQGLRPFLNAIRTEEAGQGRPDLGALVLKMSTDPPSYVGAGQDAREKAIAGQEAVFAAREGN